MKETLVIQTDEDPREDKRHPTLVENKVEVEIDGQETVVRIGATLQRTDSNHN